MVTRDTSNVEIHGSIPCQGSFFDENLTILIWVKQSTNNVSKLPNFFSKYL